MRRALILSSLILGALAPTAAAQTPQPPHADPRAGRPPAPAPTEPPRIRPGVFVAGVEVSNLTVAEARAGLRAAFAPAYTAPIVVAAAGKRFALKRGAAGFRFNARATARQALAAGAATPPAADGSLPPVAVAPVVSFKRPAIRAFIQSVRTSVAVAPVDASLGFSIRHIVRRHSKPGRALLAAGLRPAIEQRARRPRRGARAAAGPARHPRQGRAGPSWRKRYPTVISIEQSTFTLRLFKHFKLAKTYRVAVGQPAYPTPSGTVRGHVEAGEPDLDGAELAVGGRARGPERRRRRGRQPAQGALDGARRRRSASTAPGSRGRSARARRTAASA